MTKKLRLLIALVTTVLIFIAIAYALLKITPDDYVYYNFFELRDHAEKKFEKFLFLDQYIIQPEIDSSATLEGWQATNESISGAAADRFLRSNGKTATLALHFKKKTDTQFVYRMKNADGLKRQTISFLLNDKPVANRKSTDEYTVRRIEFPANIINVGQNLLTLKFDTTLKPDNRSILLDWFFYSNPQLNPRFKTGRSFIPALAAPPGKQFSFGVEIPKQARLDFFLGLMQMNTGDKPGSYCNFTVSFEEKNERTVLFTKNANKDSPKYLNWRHKTLDLSKLAGRSGKIVFATESNTTDEGELSDIIPLWGSPILYGAAKIDPKPKVLLISIDTLRADHLRCYGYGRKTSPSIDELARDGVLFENHYAASSWTLPSHLSLLTGTYPSHHQNMHPLQRPDQDIKMLAEILKITGYYNYAYTTWAYVAPRFGFDVGFDIFEYSPSLSSTLLVKRALYRIKRNPDIRGFYFLHFIDPHFSYFPPPEYRNIWDKGYKGKLEGLKGGKWSYFIKFSPKELMSEDLNHVVSLYDGEILYTDHSLGKLFGELKKLGLYDNMLIILTSDHGEAFLDHGQWLHTWTLYQEIIRVPLIIKFPGSKAAGTRIRESVSQMDVLPTILDYLDINPPKNIDGKSLIPLIMEKGDSTNSRVTVSETIKPQRPMFSFINGSSKYIYTLPVKDAKPPVLEREEFYDLMSDPEEMNNLKANKTPVMKMLFKYRPRYIEAMKSNYMLRHKTGERKIDAKTRKLLRSLGYIGY